MCHQSPLGHFIAALAAWGEDLFERGHPVPPAPDNDIPGKISAVEAFAPLERRAVELSLWLRSRGFIEQADALDQGLEDVRGWAWAYDDGRTSSFEIDDGYTYREIDYIVEASRNGEITLLKVDESLPAEVWDGFIDE